MKLIINKSNKATECQFKVKACVFQYPEAILKNIYWENVQGKLNNFCTNIIRFLQYKYRYEKISKIFTLTAHTPSHMFSAFGKN